jgi:ribonuclease HII
VIRAKKATFELEAIELELGGGPIAGVDEAGRGPLAGPVVAAAVVLDRHNIPDGIADSKALDVEARRSVYQAIVTTAEVGIGVAEVDRIDAENILNASLWAMTEAVARLARGPRLALIDGNRPPALACATRCIVQGDARCLSIAAASIVAKVVRDRAMRRLDALYPSYDFASHVGYITPGHSAIVRRLGPSSIHRRSFDARCYAELEGDASKAELVTAARA